MRSEIARRADALILILQAQQKREEAGQADTKQKIDALDEASRQLEKHSFIAHWLRKTKKEVSRTQHSNTETRSCCHQPKLLQSTLVQPRPRCKTNKQKHFEVNLNGPIATKKKSVVFKR